MMSLVEELQKEGEIKRSREIAIEMLKDGMSIEQVIKFTKLTEDVMKLKQHR